MDNIRASSLIDSSFRYGENLKIGNFCIIEKDCIVGDNVTLMDYVKLMPGTRIGHNCQLDDYANTSGYCQIGNNVRIKRCTMIGQACKIEDNVKIMSHVTTIRMNHPEDEHEDEEWVTIKEGAIIGSHSCILAGVTIGKGAMVGAGAVVTKDCEPGGVYVGNPAKKIRLVRDDEKRATL